ncbi:MAG: hypothetical protein E7158_03445 [Firmicutes bacterium]|nr:hypothetical protein [Bacillota bacterium]
MNQEIDLQRVLNSFKQRIVLIAFITFLTCVFVSCYVLFFEKPIYKSTATLVLTGISSSNNTSDGITTNDLTINSQLVSTYQEIIKSKKVLNQVIDVLSLEMTPEELGKIIKVSAVNDTEIISITVTHRNPSIATKIANEVSNIFSDEVIKIYNIENVTMLDSAEIPPKPANMEFLKKFGLAFVCGIILGSVIAFLLAYFDTTIKTVEQIEEITNLPILGRVPSYNKKRKER